MVVMAAVYAQWYSVSGGLGGQQTYTEEALREGAPVPAGDGGRALPERPPAPSLMENADLAVKGPQEPHYFPPTLYPTVTPTLAPPPTPVAQAASVSGQLTEAEMRALLAEAGWPAELIPQALAVSWCESKWSPGAIGDSGRSVGLFQVNAATWFPYAGEDASQWADPLVNARVAWATYNYDIARGYAPWKQWTCKP